MNDRDLNLDFVKGFLVISMVIYHTFNYFTTVGYSATQYVRYSTGAFIFISGYLVATYYKNKFYLNKKDVCKRLIIRGLKLLLIFLVINLIISLIGLESHKKIYYDLNRFLNNLNTVLISGNTNLFIFPILVPISYALLLSPLFLFFHAWEKSMIAMTALLVSAYLIIDIDIFNLWGLMIGIIGMLIGLLQDSKKIYYSIKSKALILSLFCVCIFLMKYFDRNILSYIIGILIILKLVYDFSKTQNPANPVSRIFISWGQYTLFGYLSQIFFLQILRKFIFKDRFDLGYKILLIIIITSIFLFILCKTLDLLRNRFYPVDKLYKFIFS